MLIYPTEIYDIEDGCFFASLKEGASHDFLMKITISNRYRPFSHKPGVSCLLPGTDLVVCAYPTLLIFQGEVKVPLEVEGPVNRFTLQQDIESGKIYLWGFAKGGYYHLTISADSEARAWIKFRGGENQLVPLPKPLLQGPLTKERLSLGSHKQQDWDLVLRRGDPREIYPILLKLASSLPIVEKGNVDSSLLMEYFQANFRGILTPVLFDDLYQGIRLPSVSSLSSPLKLLSQCGNTIRSLFIKVEDHTITLLPHLPKEGHCGRFTQLSLGEWGVLDMEWSKGLLRRAHLKANRTGVLHFKTQKELRSCRLVDQNEERRRQVPLVLEIQKGHTYCLDRFEK